MYSEVQGSEYDTSKAGVTLYGSVAYVDVTTSP